MQGSGLAAPAVKRIIVPARALPVILVLMVASVIVVFAYQLPRALRVDVGGNGRGLIAGFAAAEKNGGVTFRWSGENGVVSLPSLAGGTYDLSVSMAAPRPPGAPLPTVMVYLDERPLMTFIATPDFRRRTVRISVAPRVVGDHTVRIHSDTFTEQGGERRALGVAVDEVALRPVSWPLVPPLAPLVAFIADALLISAILARWRARAAPFVALGALGVGLLSLVALRQPFGILAYQCAVPLVFVEGSMQTADWLRRGAARPAWIVGALIVLAYAALSAATVLFDIRDTTNDADFAIFYRSAAAVWTGHPEQLYDLKTLAADPLFGPTNHQPAFASVLIAPLAILPYPTAVVAFRIVLVLCMVAGVWLLAVEFNLHALGTPRGWPLVALVALTLLWSPLRDCIALGQWDAPLFLLLVLALVGLRRDWPFAVGVCLAVATLIKVYPLYLALALVIRRRWRALGWLAATLIFLTALSAFVVGASATRTWFVDVLPHIGGMTSSARNQSFLSLLARLPGLGGLGNMEQSALTLLVALLGTALVSRHLSRSPASADTKLPHDIPLAVCAMLLIIPIAWIHYETVLLIPVAALLATLAETADVPAGRLALAAGSIALLLFGNQATLLAATFGEVETVGRAIILSTRVFAQIGLMLALWGSVPHLSTSRGGS